MRPDIHTSEEDEEAADSDIDEPQQRSKGDVSAANRFDAEISTVTTFIKIRFREQEISYFETILSLFGLMESRSIPNEAEIQWDITSLLLPLAVDSSSWI